MTHVPQVRRRPVVAGDRMAEDPAVPTLTGLLAQRALDAGDREFLRFGEWSWTFAEIDAWTSRGLRRSRRPGSSTGFPPTSST